MPLYEYACATCGHEFEKMTSFAEADKLPACPQCASPDTHKKLSRVAAFGSDSGGGYVSSGGGCGSSGGFS